MVDIDDGLLIDLVRQYPLIYDKKDKMHKSKLARENAFRTIADIMGNGIDGATCETRWQVLRNRFATELRALKLLPSGSGATSTWMFFEAMLFLKEHIYPRKTRGNISSSNTKKASSMVENQIASTSTQSPESLWDTMTTIIEESSRGSQDMVETPEIEPDENNVENPSEPVQKTTQAPPSETTSKGKRRKQNNDEVLSNITATCSNISNYLANKKEENEIDLFTKSIGISLRKVEDIRVLREIQTKLLNVLLEYGI